MGDSHRGPHSHKEGGGELGFEPGSDGTSLHSPNPTSPPLGTFGLASQSTGCKENPDDDRSQHLSGGHHAPDAVLSHSVQDQMCSRMCQFCTLTTSLSYSHLTDEKTEAQRGYAPCSRSRS